jgi:hypothetical protein
MAGAGFKTFTAGDILSASDTNTYLMQQTVMNFATTAARGSAFPSPYEGLTTYIANTNSLEIYNGSAWVAVGNSTYGWISYTPSLTNISLGNGSVDFAYSQIGARVNVRGRLTFGSTTSISGSATFSLPATATGVAYGSCILRANNTDYEGVAVSTSSTVVLSAFNSAGTYSARANTSATVPATWTTGDLISFSLTYEAA